MELHEIIKQHRLESGLTQEQLAEKLFITRQSISRWETGKVNPPLNALYDLADIYNLSLEEFLKGKMMKKTKLSTTHLLGSLIFNLFLLMSGGLSIVIFWLGAWFAMITLSLAPLIFFVAVKMYHFAPFAWDQFFYSLIFCAIGCAALKPLLIVSKSIWKMCVNYFRYNLSTIFYEVEVD